MSRPTTATRTNTCVSMRERGAARACTKEVFPLPHTLQPSCAAPCGMGLHDHRTPERTLRRRAGSTAQGRLMLLPCSPCPGSMSAIPCITHLMSRPHTSQPARGHRGDRHRATGRSRAIGRARRGGGVTHRARARGRRRPARSTPARRPPCAARRPGRCRRRRPRPRRPAPARLAAARPPRASAP